MANISRTVALLSILLAAGCARAVPTGHEFEGSGGNGGGGGGGSNGGFSDDSDAAAFAFAAPDANTNILGDGAATLAGLGSVGLCRSSRTCDIKVCDELQENGQHEYVEQQPDDGSQIPFKDVPSAQQAFSGSPSSAAGPCIVEPPDGALFPNNWVRARIRVRSPNASIYRIRIHADRQANDLVVYTKSPTWKIPKDIWDKLSASTWGEQITVTVSAIPSGSNSGASPVSSTVKFVIAPAFANGQIIYWTTVGNTKADQAWLESFSVGDENVAVALTVPESQWRLARDETGNLSTRASTLNLPAGSPACIGCHVAVPDRQTVTFIEEWPWDGVANMVDPNDTGQLPPWLTTGGAQALSMPWLGMMTFSPHVWNDLNQHIMVAAMQNETPWNANAPDAGTGAGGAPFAPWGFQSGNEWDQSQKSNIGWIDLSTSAPATIPVPGNGSVGDQLSLGMAANYGTSWGVIARNGDTAGAASPTWAHLTGDTIVYASTNASRSGREGPSNTSIKGFADLWSVPFNGGAGGTATPIPGASDPAFNEYYPSYSPDDKFIAFNRTPAADDMYYAPNSEVYVIPSQGGTPTRLKANDPPACMGVTSPGITNSWPKWAPEYPVCSGLQYYWLIFSSAREQIPFNQKYSSQLYLTALVVGEDGLTSYPGVFIWNQHLTSSGVPTYNGMPQSNHTPQWEGIDLPPPPPPPMPPPAQLPAQ